MKSWMSARPPGGKAVASAERMADNGMVVAADVHQARVRTAYPGDNAKLNEYLHRRVDIEDVVSAHLLALERARIIGTLYLRINYNLRKSVEDIIELGGRHIRKSLTKEGKLRYHHDLRN